jgi:hypothetical protein
MSNTWEGGPSDGDYEQDEGKPDLSTNDLQCVEDAEKCRMGGTEVMMLEGE